MNTLSILKPSAFLIILLVVASQSFVSVTKATVGQSEAASALTNAEDTLNQAYQAISQAEESGANVTSLLVRLNEAGQLLARGQLAYDSGDFDSALRFTNQSQENLNGFITDANTLRETAIRESYLDFLINVVGPVFGAVGVFCVGFFVWFFLKRKYEKVGKMV